MDHEKARRTELILALQDDFDCFEEVTLRHATFTRQFVRADVVGVPRDPRLNGFALAFEVKEPTTEWHYPKWSHAVKQSSDYVYGRIQENSSAATYAGRRISAAFLFPAPPYKPESLTPSNSPFMRYGQEALHAGILHLALHFRVGYAYWNSQPKTPRFTLCFGPNRVWEQRFGFTSQGLSLLSGSRPLGSRRIDFKEELDGF